MKRYYLQEGDGVQVGGADLMLVMDGRRLTLPDFDVGAVTLEFHWKRAEPYPVYRDAGGFYVEVDEAVWEELQGIRPP